MAGKKGRSGPPKGSRNGLKNGTSMRLTLGTLPLTMRRQAKNALAYRRALETCVEAAKGEITITDAHLIDEATNAELHAIVCKWLLRTRLETMSVSDIARCSEQILKSKTIRNKAIQQLQLEKPPENPWIEGEVV